MFLDLHLHAEDRRMERQRNANVAWMAHPDSYKHEDFLRFLATTD